MNIKLSNIKEYLRASLWFIPVLMSAMAIGSAFLMLHLDDTLDLDEDLTRNMWFYSGGAENARAILSTISSSMIQVAGVVFSITIVVLSLSSSQFGPRLLRTFMKDWSTQLVLGSFVATYIYCLVVLRNVITQNDRDVVPNLSIAFAMVLTLVNIVVLIYFIHHIATSIQADKVIDRVDKELAGGVSRLFPEELGEGREEVDESGMLDRSVHTHRFELRLAHHGYLQALDTEELWELGGKADLLLELMHRPGQYIIARSTVCIVHARMPLPEGLAEQMRSCFILGYQRTPEQDVEFSLDQLVEVALRALSPSLNDPFTAMACVDRLTSAVTVLAGRRFPSAHRFSKEGRLRMITHHPVTFPLLFSTAFDRIRIGASENPTVLIRMLRSMGRLLEHCRTHEQRELVQGQARMLMRACEQVIEEPHDLAAARSAWPIPGPDSLPPR
jgi:uncharacterized membrane protein